MENKMKSYEEIKRILEYSNINKNFRNEYSYFIKGLITMNNALESASFFAKYTHDFDNLLTECGKAKLAKKFSLSALDKIPTEILNMEIVKQVTILMDYVNQKCYESIRDCEKLWLQRQTTKLGIKNNDLEIRLIDDDKIISLYQLITHSSAQSLYESV